MPPINPLKALFEKKGFKKYFFNSGWLMVNKVVRLIMGLLVGLFVARYLGPERYGLFNFAVSFVALFGAFSHLGLEWVVTRNVVEHPEMRDELLGTAFGLQFIGSILLIGLVLIAIQFTGSDRLTCVMVMIVASSYMVKAFNVIEVYFQSQVRGRLASIANMSSLIISSIIKLILIWCQASLIWFVWVIFINRVVKGTLLCTMYAKQYCSLMNWRMRLRQAKTLFKDSWPLMLSGMVIMINMRMDQVMIKMILGNEAVGLYVPSVKLSEIWYFLPLVITQSTFPAIMNAKGDEALYYARLQGLFSLMIWLAIGLAVPICLLSEPIVSFLYGAAYAESGEVLAIYVWAGIPTFFGTAWSKWIIAENRQAIISYCTTGSMIINVILNLLLIKRMGIQGAAWATVLSSFASVATGLLIYRRKASLRMFFRSLLLTTMMAQLKAIFRR